MDSYFLKLTDKERQELTKHRDNDPRPYARERCAAVLKVADGQTPSTVARSGLLRPRKVDTVYFWLRLYQQHGLPGLLRHPQSSNRRRTLCRSQRSTLGSVAAGT